MANLGPPAKQIAPALLEALRGATTGSAFDPAAFFRKWFQTEGDSFFFLFKKNLAVTNIQFPELLGLLRDAVYSKHSHSYRPQIVFASPNEFKATLRALVQQTLDVSADIDAGLRAVVELYTPLLESLVVVRPFYSSCAVYFPPHLTIELVSICGSSGYIHSCGPAVYIRKQDKARQRDLFSALDQYLVRYKAAGRKVSFAPYAHEDFSRYDKDLQHVRDELRHGLDDVKLHVEKMNIGSTALASVLQKMRSEYSDRLDIPEAGNYKVKQRATSKNTLWLIGDSGIDPNDIHKPMTDRYLICYDQWYYNDSPFIIFDENKPAWLNHTTIPHTLLAGMLNITKPWVGTVDVADPFAGTGTTLLEVAKDSRIRVSCSDLNPLVELVFSDNIEFFALPPHDIDALAAFLQQIVEELRDATASDAILGELFPGPLSAYRWASALVDKYQGTIIDLANRNEVTQLRTALHDRSLFDRVVFYVCLRANIRHQGAFERGSETRLEAFRKSASELIAEIADCAEWSRRARTAVTRIGNFGVFAARYSDRCSIHPTRLTELAAEWSGKMLEFGIRDARNIRPHSYDIIVTDPPYGYNTDEQLIELAKLYKEVISSLIEGLRDRGQLVVSLPERSKLGKPVPFFTRATTVVQQVLADARRLGAEVISPSETLPTPRQLFRPPFYWESERALTRTVLHFRFRKS